MTRTKAWMPSLNASIASVAVGRTKKKARKPSAGSASQNILRLRMTIALSCHVALFAAGGRRPAFVDVRFAQGCGLDVERTDLWHGR